MTELNCYNAKNLNLIYVNQLQFYYVQPPALLGYVKMG